MSTGAVWPLRPFPAFFHSSTFVAARRTYTVAMFANELAGMFTRDLTRLVQELRAFPDTSSLWRVAPGVTNAAGTLGLHLEGNLREFVGRQLGGHDYARDRPAEFSTRDVAQDELVRRAEGLVESIPPVIASLDAPTLDARYPQDAFNRGMSTRQFLLHLYGHLNYHLGQIDYLRRLTTGDGAIALEP